MSVIVFPGVKPIKHPGRRVSEDEMQSRGLCDLKDPNAKLPTRCAVCQTPSSPSNPLRFEPVTKDMKMLVKCYLYRARCALGCGRNGNNA